MVHSTNPDERDGAGARPVPVDRARTGPPVPREPDDDPPTGAAPDGRDDGEGWWPPGRRGLILRRAARWVALRVPYTMYGYHEGWRADCSGYVSMAWQLETSLTTVTLPRVAHRIHRDELLPGDVLLNTAPGRDGHVVLFDRWTDGSRTSYLGYEQCPGGTRHHPVPYPYVPGHGSFEPYRLDALGE